MALSLLSRKIAFVTVASLASTAFYLHANKLEVVSYTYDIVPHVNYPDPDLDKLTDGLIVADQAAPPYDRAPAAGWLRNPTDPEKPLPAMIFDLGEMKYIDEIAINYVMWPGAGVRAPNEVRVSYSMDGQEFILEEIFTGFDGSDNSPYVTYTRNLSVLPERKAARYVRLDFRQGPGEGTGPNRSVFHFFNEISFYGRDIEDLDTPAAAAIFPAVELELETVPSAIYQIQASSDPGGWENFGPMVLGNGELYQVFTSANPQNQTFRVRTND